MSKPQIAFSKDFMAAYSRLPKRQQKRVRQFTERFRADPTSAGLNFERIQGAADDKVRSVRIDDAYRAIIVHPPKGDVYLCVWVDHHDEAYRWAQNKRFEVNPKSGVFQLYEMVEGLPAAAETPPQVPEPIALFDDHDDEDLLFAGVPMPLLATVRALHSDDELDALAPHLPEDAAEMLYSLAAGFSLVEAIEELDRSKVTPAQVDTHDFQQSLAQPDSQRVFTIVEGEKELEEMLDAPLEQWRTFLHPTQTKLVQMNAKGPVRVLGGAGTGKTVVLMHRAKHLLRNVFTDENDRILVTTYTRNLAMDLQTNLTSLCGEDARRLDIVHLHSWADRFMRRYGHTFRMISDAKRRHFFEQAVAETDDFEQPLPFFWEEWDRVVQPQDIESKQDYLTARRVGRGTRLSKRQRAGIWEVFARYRELLTESHYVEWQDLIRETRLFIERQEVPLPYAAVLADETQDFTVNGLKLLRVLAPSRPNSLYLVGDGHQRIYGHPIAMSKCGIEIRGRSRRLKLSYRTTQQIRDTAVALLESLPIDDLDGGVDSLKGYCSLRSGPDPTVTNFASEAEEAEYIVDTLKSWSTEVPTENICVATRTNGLLKDRYAKLLEGADIAHVVVRTDPEREAKMPGIRLATMHRMKGLEFSRVLLAGVHGGTMPLEIADLADYASLEDHELRERCLLYVACTRARDELVIAGYGEPSPFLK